MPGPVKVVAVAVLAAGAAAVDLVMKMQSADTAIATSGGISVKAATAIGNAFLSTAGTTEFSGQKMAEAYATVAGQLRSTEGHALSTKDAMLVMSAAGDLATAKQIDLGTATSSVAGVMQAFSLQTRDAAGVADILFNASVATGQGVDTLSAGLEKMKSKLGDAAPPLGQLAGLMVDLTNHGETGRAALTAVSAATQTLITAGSGVAVAQQAQASAFAQLSPKLQALAGEYKEGKISSTAFTAAAKGLSVGQTEQLKAFVAATTGIETAREKLANMGITVINAQGKFVGMSSVIGQLHDKIQGETQAQQLATLTTDFGAASASKMLSVVLAGPKAYDAATAAVTKSGSAHAAAAKEAGTFEVQLKTLLASADDLLTKFGSFLIPILEVVAKVFLSLTDILLKHKMMMVVLAGVIFAALVPAMASMVTGIAAATAAWIAEAAAAIAANAPIYAVIAVIALLVAAGYELYKHWGEIWGEIKRLVGDAVDFIKTHLELILTILLGPLGFAIGYLATHWKQSWADIKAATSAAWNFIWNDVLSPIIHVYEFVIMGAIHLFEKAWSDVWHGVQSVVEEVWDILKSIFGDIMKGIDDITGGISKVEHVAGSIAHGAAGVAGDVAKFFGVGKGGIISKPGVFLVGESGPEAVIPLNQLGKSGGVQPLPGGGASGGMGGSALTHSGDVNFYIAGAPQMTQTQLMTEMSFAVKTGAFQITPAKAS
jgi:hypothetical protein